MSRTFDTMGCCILTTFLEREFDEVDGKDRLIFRDFSRSKKKDSKFFAPSTSFQRKHRTLVILDGNHCFFWAS